MSNNEVSSLIYLIEDGNSDLIQDSINNLKGRVTLQEYKSIIDAIFNKLDLSDEDVLKNLFSQKPTFSIKTFKELLEMEASFLFNKLKDKKESVFVSLSKNVCDDLGKMSVDDVIIKYTHEFEFIKEVKMYSEFVYLMRNYKDAAISCDIFKINNYKSEIREFMRRFNLKYKTEFIKKYCQRRINEIENDFELKPKYESVTELLSKDAFIKLSLSDIQITNNLKLKISNYFNLEIDNNELKKIISNILNNKDNDNYKLLGINSNLTQIDEKIKIYNENRTYHRIERIYLSKINKLFSSEQKKVIVEILQNNNLKIYRNQFNNTQYSLLNYLLIYKLEANCEFNIIDNNIVAMKPDKLSNMEYILLKEDIEYYKKYDGLKNSILHYYYKVSENRQVLMEKQKINIEEDVVFDDDNYQIKNNISILNYSLLVEILKKIDYKKINNYNDYQINFLKKILYKEGLLGCVMKYGSCIDISNIINGIDYCDYMDDRKIEIDRIVKLTSIYSIADDFTISILGTEVVRKLICNEQFLQTNTLEDKKNRLKKAVWLNIESLNEDYSAIPYDINTSVDGVKISRYNNNNSKIFISGIDTGTCFKLDGDDNDFVIYTVLNQNGAVFKIEYQNKFIGRISVIRNNKVIYLNSIRIKGEREEKLSKDVLDRNYIIFECVKKIAQKIITIAHENNDDIDFIVCNKAGILESSYFDEYYEIVPEHIANKPIDVFNEDWTEFILQANSLLKQSNRGSRIPFTTDYGHYPALLIASYNGNHLNTLRDVGYNTPKPIYKRPKIDLKLYTSNFKEILEDIYRIDALKYYEDIKDLEECMRTYTRPKINIKDISKVSLGEYYYKIYFIDGTTREVSIKDSICKKKKLV